MLFGSLCRATLGALAVGLLLALELAELPAAEMGNLYSIELPIDPGADDPRAAGLKAAMAELLVRLTGQRAASSDPALAGLIDAAPRFVQQWGFASQELLAVTFDGRAVESELMQLGKPVWGKDRPLTLVWIALDAGLGDRRLLTGLEDAQAAPAGAESAVADLGAEVVAGVRHAAARRGIPIAFPLLDSEDLALVTFADVWGGFTRRISAASERYGADGVLVGRLQAARGAVTARWQYLGRNEQQEYRGGVVEGLDWLADIYAGQYAVSGSPALARLTVLGVGSFNDYARVMRHLEGLSVIDAVTVEEIRDDELVVALATRARADVLDRALSLGRVIAPVPVPATDPLGVPLDAVGGRYFRVLRRP